MVTSGYEREADGHRKGERKWEEGGVEREVGERDRDIERKRQRDRQTRRTDKQKRNAQRAARLLIAQLRRLSGFSVEVGAIASALSFALLKKKK